MKMDLEVKSELFSDEEKRISDTNESLSSHFESVEIPSDNEEFEEEPLDEPLVEINSITVPQELMEVELEPTMLLFVDRNSTMNSLSDCVRASANVKRLGVKEKGQETLSITKVLRNVKKKSRISLPFSSDKGVNRNKCEEFGDVNCSTNESRISHTSLSNSSFGEFDATYSPSLPHWNAKKTPINKKLNVKRNKYNKTFSKPVAIKIKKKKLKNKNKLSIENVNKKTTILLDSVIKDCAVSSSIGEKDAFKNSLYSNKGKENSHVISETPNTKNYLNENKNSSKSDDNCITHLQTDKSNISKKNCVKKTDKEDIKKPESYDCTVCSKKFKEKSHLATHSRAHVEARNFKCNECGNLFKTKTSLLFHMKTHEEAPFSCQKCNKTFLKRKILTRHIRVVHSAEGRYNCDQCGRSFKSSNNLELHYTLHSGNKPFSCDVCGKSFVYKSTYTLHMRRHKAEDQFNCDLCLTDGVDKAELRRRCSHNADIRPWLCTVCGKSYLVKGTLKNHMKTHEPEKPFKCSECGKGFMKKQSYESHMKAHSGTNPEYMCDQCSQSYYNVFALKRHYLKHTGERRFVCDICNKAFWMKDALKVHKRSHLDVGKMHQCTECPKTFAHKHTLVAHKRIHSTKKLLSCTLCPKKFVYKHHLDLHERQHCNFIPPPQTIPLTPSLFMSTPHNQLSMPTLQIL